MGEVAFSVGMLSMTSMKEMAFSVGLPPSSTSMSWDVSRLLAVAALGHGGGGGCPSSCLQSGVTSRKYASRTPAL
eukprot:3160565-Pyramimonas_sp.AAC.1